jgi:hypothetical protein
MLHAFMDRLDFIKMKPVPEAIRSGIQRGSLALVLADVPNTYAIYISRNDPNNALDISDSAAAGTSRVDSSSQKLSLQLALPKGAYTVRWMNPQTGATGKAQSFAGGDAAPMLASPLYADDIALLITAKR